MHALNTVGIFFRFCNHPLSQKWSEICPHWPWNTNSKS